MGTVTVFGMSQVPKRQSLPKGFSCPALNWKMTLPGETGHVENTLLVYWPKIYHQLHHLLNPLKVTIMEKTVTETLLCAMISLNSYNSLGDCDPAWWKKGVVNLNEYLVALQFWHRLLTGRISQVKGTVPHCAAAAVLQTPGTDSRVPRPPAFLTNWL